MRTASVAFGFALVAFVVFPASEAAAVVAGSLAVALLPVLGHRDGTWRALRFALIVPAAAVVADVVTFTPASLQPETDATIYSYAAVYYLPAWALLVCVGIGVRRLERRRLSRTP